MSSMLYLSVPHAPTCYLSIIVLISPRCPEGNTEEERNGTMKNERRDTGTRPDRRTAWEVLRLRHNWKSAGVYTRSRRLQLSKCIIGLSTSSLPLLTFLQITEIGTVWHGNIPLHLNLFARYRLPSWTQWSSICLLSSTDFSCLSLSSACLLHPISPPPFNRSVLFLLPAIGISLCTFISAYLLWMPA